MSKRKTHIYQLRYILWILRISGMKAWSIGTVIEGTIRKDRKLKIKLDKDTTEKKYRLIKETDLQLYTFKNEKEVVCLNEKNCQSDIFALSRIYMLHRKQRIQILKS